MTTDQLRSQYDAIRHGAGILDLSSAGKLEVGGKNAVQFLNGLVTNDVKSLQPGAGVLAAFLDVHGKVKSICRIYRLADRFLLELEPFRLEGVFGNLQRFVPAGEFTVDDVTGAQALLSLQGARSDEILARAGLHPPEAPFSFTTADDLVAGATVLIARHSRSGEPGFDLFVPSEATARLEQALLEHGQELGAMRAGQDALEVARIEDGVPVDGIDITADTILLETDLDQAVSYTKGCYLGQEIIARIHWRGQPARRLRGLLIEGDALPETGAKLLTADGGTAGYLTSAIQSLALNRVIALGYVDRHFLTPGTELRLNGGTAKVAETPFVTQ
jgi:folate-binding protein YgfZ